MSEQITLTTEEYYQMVKEEAERRSQDTRGPSANYPGEPHFNRKERRRMAAQARKAS